MSKHTPGPWDIIDQYIIAGDESVICQWESYSDEADARLIAAAPDLLAALHEISRCCDERASFDGDPAMKRWCKATSEVARAAIAKAEGAS
jgi:hypothetical protein